MHGEGSAHRELSTDDPACIEVPGSTGRGGWASTLRLSTTPRLFEPMLCCMQSQACPATHGQGPLQLSLRQMFMSFCRWFPSTH